MFDPKARTEVTRCDQLTALRYDRDRLAKHVDRADMDIPAAIAQCEADLAKWPNDPRINYQLGRVYGYAEQRPKSRAAREASAAAGYPAAMFLLGYLDMIAAKTDAERCSAGERIRLSADRGGYAGLVGYPAYVLDGHLKNCPGTADAQALLAYLERARPAADGFFERMLIDTLEAQLKSQD